MTFDLRTAMVLANGMCILMGLVLYATYKAYPAVVQGLRAWTQGTCIAAVASIFLMLRGVAPDWLSVSVANGLLLTALTVDLWGTRKLLGLPFAARHWFAAAALAWCVQLAYTLVLPDILGRLVAFTVMACTLYCTQAYSVLAHSKRRPPHLFFGISMVAGGILMAIRGITALQMLVSGVAMSSGGLWDASTIQMVYLMGFTLLALLHPIGFLLMATDHMRDHLQTLSHRDPLTNTLNRRALAEVAALELERTHRHQSPLAVLALDLDLFKTINDQFGHDVGDAVLVHFAAVMQAEMRKTDHLARLGGEEFVLLLPHTDGEQATQVARRIQQSLAESKPANLPSCTCSMGLAQVTADDQGLDSAIKRADQALYRAKENGRNRLEVAPA